MPDDTKARVLRLLETVEEEEAIAIVMAWAAEDPLRRQQLVDALDDYADDGGEHDEPDAPRA